MKRLFLILSLLVIVCVALFGCERPPLDSTDEALSSSQSESAVESEGIFQDDGKVKIEYRATEGGRIEGNPTQSILPGEKTTTVRAVASEGYRFLGWSDGAKSSVRVDSPTQSIVLEARFEKLHTVTFTCAKYQGYFSGFEKQSVPHGEKSAVVRAIPQAGYRFVCWDTGETSDTIQITVTADTEVVAIFAREDLTLPVMSITTDGEENRISKVGLRGFVTVSNAGDYDIQKEPLHIRGRGNTSFEIDKRSYRIKFDDAIDLFGNGKAKKWTLISNHFDLSLVRNYLAYSAADAIGLEGTSSVQFVDLYLNGEYRGVYLVCDQIEIGNGRVDIDNGSADDRGYIVELDKRLDGNSFYINGTPYSIKEPNELSESQISFIQQYMTSCMNALYGNDYSLVESLIDTESFAKAYIIFEMFKCVDVGYSSFYMYKDAGGRLCCGPVWDFDRSVGNVRNNESARRHDSLWAKMDNTWFGNLLYHEEFKALVGELLEQYTPVIENRLTEAYAYLDEHKVSFDRNFERWKLLGTYVWPNPDSLIRITSWQGQVDFVKDYLKNSLAFIKRTYAVAQAP